MLPVCRSQNEAHEIHRDKELEVRLPLSTIQTWNSIYSPEPPVPMASAATTRKTFGLTDLKSRHSVCTRKTFGGIESRPSGLESVALIIRLPTTLS
ncbi:hypothetical protein TNCV_1907221 [Trichonephila clavipes]|nr:hypothetical protein TNCV_1907221 [Trichonephila clavipes]